MINFDKNNSTVLLLPEHKLDKILIQSLFSLATIAVLALRNNTLDHKLYHQLI